MWIKINLDAAIGDDVAVIACIACDDLGSILCCKSKRLGFASSLIAKGLAVDLVGWPAVVFESDSKAFVEVINLKNPAAWFISSMVDNCLLKLSHIPF